MEFNKENFDNLKAVAEEVLKVWNEDGDCGLIQRVTPIAWSRVVRAAEHALCTEVKDLFDTPELIPDDVKVILREDEDGDFTYSDCEQLELILNSVGYTIDWGLEAEPYNLRPL
jgi:hypothetical protein